MMSLFFFFFNDTATTEIYTLSLHDALPIYILVGYLKFQPRSTEAAMKYFLYGAITAAVMLYGMSLLYGIDRKSTRLNSSHANISYAVFCLKKKIYSPTLT